MIKQFRNIINRNRKPSLSRAQTTTAPTLFTTVAQKAQVEIISTLLTSFRDVKKLVQTNIDLISEPLLNKTAQLFLEHGAGSTAAVLDAFEEKGERETMAKILMNEQNIDDPQAVVQECLETLKTQPVRKKIQQARLKIRELEAAGKDSSDLILEVGKLQEQLRTASVNDQ
jgi:hypothetical protein